MGQWAGHWLGPGQIIENQINLDQIKIIQFCLKIYDLLRHPDLWVGVWVVGWMDGLICGSMETTWGQHEDNVETTWGPQGCGAHWGQCGDMGHGDHGDMETMLGQHGDNVRTMWRWHGDNMGTMGMCRPGGGNMETTWGQHGDNVETTWGPQGCGDHVGTTWRQCGDHGDVQTMWGQHGDNMRTMWRPTWGQVISVKIE